MWSNEYATPLHLDVRPSRVLTVAVGAMHVFAFGFAVSLPGAGWQSLLLGLLVIVSWLRLRIRHPLWPNAGRITSLVWGRDASWEIGRAGGVEPARLGKEAVVTPYLVIVPLQLESGRRLHLPILADMLDPTTFRRLRVRLRLYGQTL
jgi:hypothetical protein